MATRKTKATVLLNRRVRLQRASARLIEKIVPMRYEVLRSGRVVKQFVTLKEAEKFAWLENMSSDLYTSTVRKITSPSPSTL